MVGELGASWGDVARVVVTTVGIYTALVVLIRVVGQRSLASMSGFDVGCVVALGAILGRTALLESPTLLIGVVALVTFFAMQGVLGVLRQDRRFDRLVNRPPVLLVDDGEVLTDALRRAHVSPDELRQRLRLAGVRRLDEVASVVLERNGAVSVLRRGSDVDPWILADVAAARGTRG
ncbi:YetF domain-containing protein [Cellulomonas sp. ATA003]|uniref:DUF421 domain-containing protein n=1 Tax=Cellulomonas sp. ATA003 TaxID=3073064 RepID=UPI002872AFCF|nr:YetF domain-containing protein [Cellulomonas sp. ATA003]WNB86937.1 DUF421 domain-containing protein [Cellulomonas sp. ATA003]